MFSTTRTAVRRILFSTSVAEFDPALYYNSLPNSRPIEHAETAVLPRSGAGWELVSSTDRTPVVYLRNCGSVGDVFETRETIEQVAIGLLLGSLAGGAGCILVLVAYMATRVFF